MKKNYEEGLPARALAQAGQTLLEILLAFGVSMLVLSAIIIGITTSLSNAQYAKNQNLATSYAQEGMAVIRQIRNSSWTEFSKDGENYCIGQDPTKLAERTSASCGQNVGIFSREVVLKHNSSKCCSNADTSNCVGGLKGSEATVKVSWSDSKCSAGTGSPYCHKVELISCFSTIDPTPTPIP